MSRMKQLLRSTTCLLNPSFWWLSKPPKTETFMMLVGGKEIPFCAVDTKDAKAFARTYKAQALASVPSGLQVAL